MGVFVCQQKMHLGDRDALSRDIFSIISQYQSPLPRVGGGVEGCWGDRERERERGRAYFFLRLKQARR